VLCKPGDPFLTTHWQVIEGHEVGYAAQTVLCADVHCAACLPFEFPEVLDVPLKRATPADPALAFKDRPVNNRISTSPREKRNPQCP